MAAAFATPGAVVAGQTYAIMVRYISDAPIELLATWGGYAGGQNVSVSPSGPGALAPIDMPFRIYVDTTRLTLAGAAAPNPAPLNQTLTFTFTAGNTGSAVATNTVLTVDLPSVVQVQSSGFSASGAGYTCQVLTLTRLACTLGTIAAGGSIVVPIPVRIISATLGAQLCARGIVTGGPAGMTSTATAQACARAAAPLPGDLTAEISCPTTAIPPLQPADRLYRHRPQQRLRAGDGAGQPGAGADGLHRPPRGHHLEHPRSARRLCH